MLVAVTAYSFLYFVKPSVITSICFFFLTRCLVRGHINRRVLCGKAWVSLGCCVDPEFVFDEVFIHNWGLMQLCMKFSIFSFNLVNQ